MILFDNIKEIYRDNYEYKNYNKINSNDYSYNIMSFIARYFTATKYFLIMKGVNASEDELENILFNNCKYESDNTIRLFINWFQNDGYKCFNYILKNLNYSCLNDKVNSFIEYYDFLLRDAIEVNDLEVLMNWLFIIPKKMMDNFSEHWVLSFVKNK